VVHSRFQYATRLNSFRAERAGTLGVSAALDVIASVPGISAVELNYPQHFPPGSESTVLDHAKRAGLEVTAINLRFDRPLFADGAFTNPAEDHRRRATAISCDAVDLAASIGVDHVILWMGPDGYDYPFQADYRRLWAWEIEGFRQVAGHNPEIRVSVEYKPSDPRRTSLIRSMSDSLMAVNDVNLSNFGVTIDFCHALMAGEQPAAAAALALSNRRLFGVHLNDGYGPADDGLMVGSVHPWHTLELLWVLRQNDFTGTIYFDTFPERIDPAGECAANVQSVKRFERILDRVDSTLLSELQVNQDALGVTQLLQQLSFEVDRA
jgi:xylose isomerase